MPRRKVPALLLSCLLSSSSALALSGKCNKSQSECELTSTSLTIGDKIAVVNPAGETVAFGEVDRIEDMRRIVKIRKRMRKIAAQDSFELITRGKEKEFEEKSYRSPVKTLAGASVGLTSIAIGGGAAGFELAGFGGKRITAKGQLIGRASFLTLAADITSSDGYGQTRSKTCNYKIIGATAGYLYPLLAFQKLTLSGEADGGLTMVMQSCGEPDGEPTPGERWRNELAGGAGLTLRGTAMVAYAVNSWKITGGYAFQMVKDAPAHSMWVGFLSEWR